MSCITFSETKGVVLGATPEEVLDYNVHRKGLFLACVQSSVKIAFGESPVEADYFDMPAGSNITFDSMVPISKVWCTGSGGTLVYGEST